MDQETMDAARTVPAAAETKSPAQPGTGSGAGADTYPLDARALVEKMIEAGQSSEPDLMEQIAAKGREAVEPLLDIVRSKPRGWPDEIPLSHALGLLKVIRDPAAIPELIEIVKNYADDAGAEAAEALASYGEGIFDTLLEFAADPGLRGYYRSHAIFAARNVAGAHPALRARFAELIRTMLSDAIERARRPPPAKPAVYQPYDDAYEMNIYDEISFLVRTLAGVADPLARELIRTAFEEDLIDEPYSVDVKSIDLVYERGGDPVWTPSDWLADYRESYHEYATTRASINKLAAELSLPSPPTKSPPPPAPPKPVAPMAVTIRNKAQAVGRNDPCWCGSGKKYKKCHLGKDTTA